MNKTTTTQSQSCPVNKSRTTKIKARNCFACSPILRKGGVHGKSRKALRAIDKARFKKEYAY